MPRQEILTSGTITRLYKPTNNEITEYGFGDITRRLKVLRVSEEEILELQRRSNVESHGESGFYYQLDTMVLKAGSEYESRILAGNGEPKVESRLHGHPLYIAPISEVHYVTRGKLVTAEFRPSHNGLTYQGTFSTNAGETHVTEPGIVHLSVAGEEGVEFVIELKNAGAYPKYEHHNIFDKTIALPPDYFKRYISLYL